MPAELLGTDDIFLLQRLDSFQDAVEFINDGIKLFIQLFVHPLINGFKNDANLSELF